MFKLAQQILVLAIPVGLLWWLVHTRRGIADKQKRGKFILYTYVVAILLLVLFVAIALNTFNASVRRARAKNSKLIDSRSFRAVSSVG